MNDKMLESIKEDVEYIGKYIDSLVTSGVLAALQYEQINARYNKIIGKLEMLDILLGDLK